MRVVLADPGPESENPNPAVQPNARYRFPVNMLGSRWRKCNGSGQGHIEADTPNRGRDPSAPRPAGAGDPVWGPRKEGRVPATPAFRFSPRACPPGAPSVARRLAPATEVDVVLDRVHVEPLRATTIGGPGRPPWCGHVTARRFARCRPRCSRTSSSWTSRNSRLSRSSRLLGSRAWRTGCSR